MNIIIFGPPLAGKGTQSKRILQKFGLTHLSTGDALRAEKEKGTDLGEEAAKYSKKGLLAPDHLVSKVVERFYNERKSGKGILFDGYPRNTEQAKHLFAIIEGSGDKIDKLIYLKVTEDELLKRAEKRAEEEGREDDKNSDIVLTRIEEFSKSTVPAINWLIEQGIDTITVNGNNDIDTISNEIIEGITKSNAET